MELVERQALEEVRMFDVIVIGAGPSGEVGRDGAGV